MRIREEAKHQAKQQVPAKDFWTAIAAVIILLVIIGVYAMPLEHSPAARWIWGVLLLSAWNAHLWSIFRFGWRAYSWDKAASLLGVTLLLGQDVWPHTPTVGHWTRDVGMILVMVSIFAPYFTSSPRLKNGSGAG